jgi:DNA primase
LNIFQAVKESVTARQAAEQYGLKISRNGMVCCPFHDDRHPSMKVDKGFCCFACGAKGDVITFVADFFHLAPFEAAKKLAEDFHIPIFTDNAKKRNGSKKKEKPKRTFYQTEKKFEEWERESIRILSDYLHLLEEACQQIEKISYYLDLLVFGELQDRIEFLLDSGKDVKRIEERMEEYRRNNKEQTGRSIGSEGNEL